MRLRERPALTQLSPVMRQQTPREHSALGPPAELPAGILWELGAFVPQMQSHLWYCSVSTPIVLIFNNMIRFCPFSSFSLIPRREAEKPVSQGSYLRTGSLLWWQKHHLSPGSNVLQQGTASPVIFNIHGCQFAAALQKSSTSGCHESSSAVWKGAENQWHSSLFHYGSGNLLWEHKRGAQEALKPEYITGK